MLNLKPWRQGHSGSQGPGPVYHLSALQERDAIVSSCRSYIELGVGIVNGDSSRLMHFIQPRVVKSNMKQPYTDTPLMRFQFSTHMSHIFKPLSISNRLSQLTKHHGPSSYGSRVQYILYTYPGETQRPAQRMGDEAVFFGTSATVEASDLQGLEGL